MSIFRWLLLITYSCLFLILLSGYLGHIHPVGDSLALLRVPLAILGMSAVFLIKPEWFGWVITLFSLALVCLWVIDRKRDTGNGPYVLYQKNLLFLNTRIDEIAADIRAQNADFVTLQEVSNKTRPILDLLKPDYPYQLFCPFATVGGVAVLSRIPNVKAGTHCAVDRKGLAALLVDTPQGRVWIASVHLYWPYPSGQAAQVDQLVQELETLYGPVILGADLNMFANTRVTKILSSATGTAELRPLHTSFERHGIAITIDHVFAPFGRLTQRPKLGSDHYGIVAHVGLEEG